MVLQVGQEVSSQIMALATDFPRLWMAPATADKDRKRMVRLLIEDVTLTKKKDILMQVRFKGGTTTSLTLPIPKNAWQKKITPPEVVQQIDKLLDQYTDCQTAEILNKQKLKSGTGGQFHGRLVAKIRKAYGLKNRYDRLCATGMLTVQEMEQQIGVCSTTIKIWHREGLLRGHVYNGRGQALYEPPGLGAPTKGQGRKLPERKQFPKVVSDRTNEVQYEV